MRKFLKSKTLPGWIRRKVSFVRVNNKQEEKRSYSRYFLDYHLNLWALFYYVPCVRMSLDRPPAPCPTGPRTRCPPSAGAAAGTAVVVAAAAFILKRWRNWTLSTRVKSAVSTSSRRHNWNNTWRAYTERQGIQSTQNQFKELLIPIVLFISSFDTYLLAEFKSWVY